MFAFMEKQKGYYEITRRQFPGLFTSLDLIPDNK